MYPGQQPHFSTSQPVYGGAAYPNHYANPAIGASVTHPQPGLINRPLTHNGAPLAHAPYTGAPLAGAPYQGQLGAPLHQAPWTGAPLNHPQYVGQPPIHHPAYALDADRRVVNLLVAIQEGETDIEACRARLCQIPDFSLNAAFQIFDHDNDGVISADEVALFLKENKSRHTDPNDCAELVDYFDANGDHVLTYNEFSQILLPCEDNVLRNVTLDRSHKAIAKLEILPGDIAEGITSVFEKEIDFSKRLEQLRRELAACGASALHTYRLMDRQHSAVVDTVNLGAFLGAHGKNFDDMQLLAIIRRIDTNGDATIDLNEWTEFLRCKAGPIAVHPQALPFAHNTRPVGQIIRNQGPGLMHPPAENQPGYHYEYPVKTVDYEPVVRMETVPVTKQIQVPVTHMESKEVSETIQVPITQMETRTETRTEMIPVTHMQDQEHKWTEQVPVTKMEDRTVTHIEMVPVTRMEPKEVTKIEQVPVTVFETQEFSRTEQIPITNMEPREYQQDFQVPVTHMQDKVVTRLEQFPVTTTENQEIVEYQQVEKTDYVAVEKVSYAYSGQSEAIRGQAVGTVPGESRYIGTSHVENVGPYATGRIPNHHVGAVAGAPLGGVHPAAYGQQPVYAGHPGQYGQGHPAQWTGAGHPGQYAGAGYPGQFAGHPGQFTDPRFGGPLNHSPTRYISPSRSHDLSRATRASDPTQATGAQDANQKKD